MKKLFAILLLAALLPHHAPAQQQPTPLDTAPAPSQKFPASWYPPANDYATTGAGMKSKPYVATQVTIGHYTNPRTHQKATATSRTLKTRDSQGRVREEVETGRPDAAGKTIPVRTVTVRDTVAHCTFSWMEPWLVLPQYDHGPVATVTCEALAAHLQDYDVFAHIAEAPEGETISGNTTRKVEHLPERKVEGLTAVATRTTTTVTLPNGTKEQVAAEWLYSPELQELLSMKQTYGGDAPPTAMPLDIYLENIRQIEPDAKLFYPPAGYRIEPTFPYGKR